MNSCDFSDANTLQSEMHLPGFSDGQESYSREGLCLDTGDTVFTELPSLELDPSLQATDITDDVLDDNLDRLSLCAVKDFDSAKTRDDSTDSDSLLSLQELGLACPKTSEEGEQRGEKPGSDGIRKGKRHHSSPQNPLQECSLCGKVFSSASSLSKHYLTHSQERRHVCKICTKAFKRQDHLTGHMLTHQKNKPFMCIEQGCNKSYCDYRSLRRHYEVQHGLGTFKEACPEGVTCCEGAQHPHEAPAQLGHSGLRTVEKPALHSESKSPNSALPSRDLLRCLVSSIVQQKLPSVGRSDTCSKSLLQPCSLAVAQVPSVLDNSATHLEGLNSDILRTCPLQRAAASSNVYTIINSSSLSVVTPGDTELESHTVNVHDDSLPLETQYPSDAQRQDSWPTGTVPCFPLFRSQKISASSQQPYHKYQWIRNMPAHSRSQGSSTSSHQPPLAEGGLPACDIFGQTCDAPSCSPVVSKASGETEYSTSEENSRPAKRQDCDTAQWQCYGDQSQQDFQNQSLLENEASPFFRQLFLKNQETSQSQDQLQMKQCLFHMIATSQHLLPHSQMAAQSQLALSQSSKSTQNMFPQQQPPNLVQPFPLHIGHDGSPVCRKSLNQLQKQGSAIGVNQEQTRGKQTVTSLPCPKTPSKTCINSDTGVFPGQTGSTEAYTRLDEIFSTAQAPPSNVVFTDPLVNQHCTVPSPLESSTIISDQNEMSVVNFKEGNGKVHTSGGRPHRSSNLRKEKLKFTLCCTASPSQVAMASFCSPSTSADTDNETKPKPTIFNRIQGGSIYSLPGAVKEGSLLAGCKVTGGSSDWTECKENFTCKNCSQPFCTEKGLNSHLCFHKEQWYSPSERREQQGNSVELVKSQRMVLPKLLEARVISPRSGNPSEDDAMSPLCMPVSVPVTTTNKQKENKTLFIPPPISIFSEGQPVQGGLYQSQLRSPAIHLADHLMDGLFQCLPYTPPPILSPIREGSGLYFNTLYPLAARATPSQLHSNVSDCGISVVRDDIITSIEPHINLGSRFQAEIPNLQDWSMVECDQHKATLVWKPWGDIESNPETQERVTQLLSVASSSAMPGGGTNLELALHCLHQTQGNIMGALEMLLVTEPKKPVHYHYTGSDFWTPAEKRLFKKAFCAHKKDFYIIQKMIQTKSIFQCVEYYYTWKKLIKFDHSRSQVAGKRMKKEQSEAGKTEEDKAVENRSIQQETQDMKVKLKKAKSGKEFQRPPGIGRETSESPGGGNTHRGFACKECERVFDKIKSRNAHMKRHRQEQMEPVVKVKWPFKYCKVEKDKEVTEICPAP
ncbi:zinc finger protein 541 [Rhinatrema bivittatum]|uniref:zinc finger protein 541 n=1 Tax=Rhinatrema bivittatum TaxID=194408 RepID=UPI00112E5610|nr:zinc finger protein 541 [Rhinatrema bivittatum]